MEYLPISLIIVTYNRKDDLDFTLSKIFNCFNIAEIIVINNASTDGTEKLVEFKYPNCKLINLDKNYGVPSFNKGAQIATQPFIFFLDDDAIPEKDTINIVINNFLENPNIHVIACNIIDNSNTSITENWALNPICFWGCGVGIRKSILINHPYLYDNRLFLHGTEMDFAIRVYSKGGLILYLKEAIIYHRFSSENRSQEKRIYYLVQSAFIFAFKHFPYKYLFIILFRHLIYLLYKSLKHHCFISFYKGLLLSCKELKLTLKDRNVVPKKIAKRYYLNVWEYEPLIFRLCRFFIDKPLHRKYKQQIKNWK
ncbi:MAG: glycosyltransferase [Bacteroidetes bacterium]|nr:glycosyltransferase [Bacteroidota bacterium]